MFLTGAFLLGFLGSLHCAGMCGPLALALPAVGNSKASFWLGRILNHLGRLATYGLLGAIFGAIGMTFALAGWQRWASMLAGAAMLLGFLGSIRRLASTRISLLLITPLRRKFSQLISRRTLTSAFALGLVNGLLPCGLVYAAAAAAVAAGGVVWAIGFMLVFGLGTVPMLLGISIAGRLLDPLLRLKLQQLTPAFYLCFGLLLLLRGLDLGIPFLSPEIGPVSHCSLCR